MDEKSLSHTSWNCKYHIVLVPKYRRKTIYGKLRKDIGKILRMLCDYKHVEIIEAHAKPDHIHMLLSIPPKLAVADFMGYLKGKSTLMIFERHANLTLLFQFLQKIFVICGLFCKDAVDDATQPITIAFFGWIFRKQVVKGFALRNYKGSNRFLVFDLFLAILGIRKIGEGFPLLLLDAICILIGIDNTEIIVAFDNAGHYVSPSTLRLDFRTSSNTFFRTRFARPTSIVGIPSSRIHVTRAVRLMP